MGVGADGLSQAAAAGAAAVVTTLLLYPLDVIKTRMNLGVDKDGVKYKNLSDVIERQWNKEGLYGFYRGMPVSRAA
jgi:hypothetical protein